jgi:hypothetical protein
MINERTDFASGNRCFPRKALRRPKAYDRYSSTSNSDLSAASEIDRCQYEAAERRETAPPVAPTEMQTPPSLPFTSPFNDSRAEITTCSISARRALRPASRASRRALTRRSSALIATSSAARTCLRSRSSRHRSYDCARVVWFWTPPMISSRYSTAITAALAPRH